MENWILANFANYILAKCAVFVFIFLHALANECVLDVNILSSGENSKCMASGGWNGFLDDNCCRAPFNSYLYALGVRANQTGEVFLNAIEQDDCLAAMEVAEKNVFMCGIETLTSGLDGCSDYSVQDVEKIGSLLEKLAENCKVLGLKNASGMECEVCVNEWENMALLFERQNGLKKEQADICRFTVLISLTSHRISDVEWIRSVYDCLGNGSLTLADQAKDREGIRFHKGLIILLVGVVVIAIVVIISSFILCRRSEKGKSPEGINEAKDYSSEEFKEPSYRKISVEEVHLATENLSASNYIGQGIAGKVYKGILSDGRHVAVKHVFDDGHMETFVREVTNLSHVKHPNLVSLLGYCNGEDECFLVYDLCHNGNLSEWLFGKGKTLKWNQRLEIAIDCARGLHFLHTYPEGCIVHRDIKPTNILLCDNFQAKLSDFGLSKVICLDRSYVSSEVRGTFGYVDPEYQKNHHVNSSTDVYSFGIVLLQILSGQRVINLDLSRPLPLSKMAQNLRNDGEIMDFADPKLNKKYSREAFELVFKLALSCTGIKQQRPSMENVVLELKKALNISARVKI